MSTREYPKVEKMVEPPTIGRVVYVYRPQNSNPEKPMVGWVADVSVNGEPLRINCAVMANNGDFILGGFQNVKHASEPRHATETFWDWMPYQKSQAKKTEALQAELDRK